MDSIYLLFVGVSVCIEFFPLGIGGLMGKCFSKFHGGAGVLFTHMVPL